MSDPFFRGFDRTDLTFIASAAKALAEDDWTGLERIFGAFGPGVVSRRPGNLLLPDSYLYISDSYVIVLVQGTEGIAQWVGQILLSFTTPFFKFDGSVSFFAGAAADTIVNDIDAVVRPALATAKLVCMGFSLGGAIAQLIGSFYRNKTPHGLSVMTLGAPRVGNPSFASAMDSFVLRLDAENDPIPSIPPELWAGPGSAYPIPGPGFQSAYKHAGTPSTLTAAGDITPGEDLVAVDEVVRQFSSGSLPTHSTAWYLAQLLSKSDLSTLPPGGDGYVNPPALYQETRVQQGLPISGRPDQGDFPMPSQLVQGLLYFRDRNVSEGWSEAFYAITDIAGMNAFLNSLLNARVLFLSGDMEIHAQRAAYVGGSKLSQTTKFPSPAVGQVAGQVNEAGDCILFTLKSAVNAHRQMTFRGVPDAAIQGDKLTPAGNALIPAINSFMAAYVLGGGGLKVPDPTVLVQPIESIQNTVAGGPIQVTSALAHGLSNGDHVNIAGIRGFPYLIGKWKIRNVTATTFILNGSERYNINLGAVGTFQGIEYVLQTATTYAFNMVSWRKTGRPFGQPHGKRAKKLLRS